MTEGKSLSHFTMDLNFPDPSVIYAVTVYRGRHDRFTNWSFTSPDVWYFADCLYAACSNIRTLKWDLVPDSDGSFIAKGTIQLWRHTTADHLQRLLHTIHIKLQAITKPVNQKLIRIEDGVVHVINH